MEEFRVRVPIEFEGKGPSAPSGAGAAAGAAGGKGLTGAIIKGGAALGALSVLLEDVIKLFQPLIKILQVLFMVVFLPLMPLIMKLTEIIAGVITGLVKLFNGEMSLGEFLKSVLIPALWEIIKTIVVEIAKILFEIGKAFLELGKQIGQWLFDKVIVPVANFITKIINGIAEAITKAIMWVVDGIKNGVQWLVNAFITVRDFLASLGLKIWEFIKNGLDFIKDLGQKIWGILKKPFDWLADKIRSINIFSSKKSVNDAIIRPNGQIIHTSPSDTIFATKNPNKLMGGGGSSVEININNPSVRNDGDIKKIAEQVNIILNRQLRGRVSI